MVIQKNGSSNLGQHLPLGLNPAPLTSPHLASLAQSPFQFN